MHTHETIEAVLQTLLDPTADIIQSANELGLTLAEFLAVAESPEVTGAIEALERIAQIRARAILARSVHIALAALERIADGDPQTPAAVETCRKAAAQILRLAPNTEAPQPVPNEAPAESPEPSSELERRIPPADEARLQVPHEAAASNARRYRVAERNGNSPTPAPA